MYPVALLPYASLAVTVKLPVIPAVVGDGKPDTISVLAAAGLTVMPVWLPVMLLDVSVTINDWLAAILSVALKVCTPASPAMKAELAGRTAWLSLLVQ